MAKHNPTSRSTLRAAQQDTELPWLFCHSDAEVSGLKASHGALVEMAQTGAARAGAGTGGIPRRVAGITARQADAVDRQRRLRQRLEQLSEDQRLILWLAYGPKEWGLAADERKRLGAPWHGVALVTEAARKGWATERRARGERVGEDDARELVQPPRESRIEEQASAGAGAAADPWRRGEDARAEVATWFAKGLGHWLRGPAVDGKLLAVVRAEAERLVGEAWVAWSMTEPPRGKRRPDWDGGRTMLRSLFGSIVKDDEDTGEQGDRISEVRVIVCDAFEPTPGVELYK